MDPLQPVLSKWERPEEGRTGPEWENRGADIVREAGKSQLCGAHAAAELVRRFNHGDFASGLRQDDSRRQAIGAGSNDERVGFRNVKQTLNPSPLEAYSEVTSWQ